MKEGRDTQRLGGATHGSVMSQSTQVVEEASIGRRAEIRHWLVIMLNGPPRWSGSDLCILAMAS